MKISRASHWFLVLVVLFGWADSARAVICQCSAVYHLRDEGSPHMYFNGGDPEWVDDRSYYTTNDHIFAHYTMYFNSSCTERYLYTSAADPEGCSTATPSDATTRAFAYYKVPTFSFSQPFDGTPSGCYAMPQSASQTDSIRTEWTHDGSIEVPVYHEVDFSCAEMPPDNTPTLGAATRRQNGVEVAREGRPHAARSSRQSPNAHDEEVQF